MPIKLKKTNIQYDIDTPEEGYIVLGFDESGNLVTKNEQGNYEPIVSDVSTGNFERLQVDFLTVGNRVSGSLEGQYSIAQGLNISASGNTSFAQGNNAKSSGLYSYARGEHVEATGERSYVSGKGATSSTPLISSGKNSFVHQDSTGGSTGSLADYSAILGGRNNDIGTGSNSSAIIGGENNQMGSGKINTIFLGCSGLPTGGHTIESNTVYVPRLVLTSTSALSRKGAIYYTGTNFYGYDGSNTKLLDMTVTNHGANRLVVGSAVSTLTAQSNLTFNGSTLSVTGSITSTSTISAGSSTISTTGTVSAGSITSGTINAGSSTISTTGTVSAGTVNISYSSTSTIPRLSISNSSSTGDASMSFSVPGDTYTMGIDNTDDHFRIYYGTSLSTIDVNTVFEHDPINKTVGIGGDATVFGMLTLFTSSTSPLPNYTYGLVIRNEKYSLSEPSRGIQIGCGVESSEIGSMVGSALSIRFTYVNSNQVGTIYYDNTQQMKLTGFNVSDERRKTNIIESDFDALSILSGITVYDFNWRKKDETGWTDIPLNGINRGYIAQRMKDIYSFATKYDEDMDLWEVKKDEMVPLLHKAIMEQQSIIQQLEQRIYDLENPS